MLPARHGNHRCNGFVAAVIDAAVATTVFFCNPIVAATDATTVAACIELDHVINIGHILKNFRSNNTQKCPPALWLWACFKI